jgi:hypothetical protein
MNNVLFARDIVQIISAFILGSEVEGRGFDVPYISFSQHENLAAG